MDFQLDFVKFFVQDNRFDVLAFIELSFCLILLFLRLLLLLGIGASSETACCCFYVTDYVKINHKGWKQPLAH